MYPLDTVTKYRKDERIEKFYMSQAYMIDTSCQTTETRFPSCTWIKRPGICRVYYGTETRHHPNYYQPVTRRKPTAWAMTKTKRDPDLWSVWM